MRAEVFSMKTMKFMIPFEKNGWNEINIEMDAYGKVYISQNEYIQILPLTESNFMPGSEKVIELVFSVTSQIALGLFVNWLYDKLKQQEVKKIVINQKVLEATDKKSITDAIAKELNEK